ncbi:MAG: hypothetical protein IPK66_01565 [Rhodospirillales bacterium]|nr:hypothetical protein [Rhodospirillales bacterium]
MQAETDLNPTANQNEGEGNRSAARVYDEKTREFIDTHDVQALSKDAAAALDSDEAAALKKAEQDGLARSRDEQPGS